MNKQKLLKPVNSIMAIDFVCLAGSALLDDVIPRETYRIVHPLFGYIFLVCVISHLFLNWAWVKSTIFHAGKNAAKK